MKSYREENRLKALALYLPQFHQVKENDEWWGEGYTEWVAVNQAEKFYEGQYEPRKPLNDNYYNLLDKKTLQWQSELAKKYGIYGFCYYHYWFEDGKKMLEKPAELLLEWKDIDMPFCFCWANQTWAATWDNVKGSTVIWREGKGQCTQTGILLNQKYGQRNEWKKHFEYLLPFFEDDRYIKIDNKPVIYIYMVDNMPCFNRMMKYWKELARENGFDGIHVIGSSDCLTKENEADAILIHEPADALNDCKDKMVKMNEKGMHGCSYDLFWKSILKSGRKKDIMKRNIYICSVVDFDNSPRRGNKAKVVFGASPKKFQKYFRKAVKISKRNRNDFIFINAWNEWAEGMYLEPDAKYGYKYLEAVSQEMERG